MSIARVVLIAVLACFFPALAHASMLCSLGTSWAPASSWQPSGLWTCQSERFDTEPKNGPTPNSVLTFAEVPTTAGNLNVFSDAAVMEIPITLHQDVVVDSGMSLTTVSEISEQFSPVPEPTSILLAALGLLGLSGLRRKQSD